MSLPHIHFPGEGETVHVYHANGFPAGVYQSMLSKLADQYDVFAMQSRATWPEIGEPNHNTWDVFADDLIEFIEEKGKPIIAIGHSMGASATILAALKRPDLFKAVVLIEPAMISMPMSILFKVTPEKYIVGSKLVQGTLNKKDNWESKEAYLKYIQKFKGFKKFDETTFHAFSQHAIKQVNDNYELVFPNIWEAHNYTQPPYLMKKLKQLGQLNMPTVAIRGGENKFFSGKLWKSWKKLQPNAVFFQDTNFTHLFPLEGPNECIELIQKGLKELNVID